MATYVAIPATMRTDSAPFDALNQAIARTGSQAKLAQLCGVSSTAVWKWVQARKALPAEFVLRVEASTGVSRHALRPDIYPIEEMRA